MNREELLTSCAEVVLKHRQSEYGTPEDNLGKIAVMWSAYLGIKLEAHDVANLMVLLKVVRSKNKPSNVDSWLDMAGYAACGCEVATSENKCLPSA